MKNIIIYYRIFNINTSDNNLTTNIIKIEI